MGNFKKSDTARYRRLAVGSAVLVAGFATGAQAATTEELDQRIRILERQLEIQQEEAKAKPAPNSVTAGGSGFALTSGDKNFDLKIRLLGQVDGRVFFNDDKTANGDTFSLRRVRPILAGTVGKHFEFSFVPEFAGGDPGTSTTSLVDLWGAIKLSPAANVKIGKYSLPVVLEAGANRHFNESPFTNSLAPNRDIGVELYGSLASNVIDYRIGVFNGSRNDTAATNADGNNDKGVAGRITVKPLAGGDGALKDLAFSLGGSVGHEGGASTTSNVNSVSRRGLFSYPATTSIDGRRTRLSPAISLYSGPFSAVAEYIVEKADYVHTTNGPFDAENTAWRTSVGYVLTGENAAGNVNPKAAFAPGAAGWGAWELVAFVSGIEFGDEFFSATQGGLSSAAQARKATAFGIGTNWYLTRHLSIRLNYEQTGFDSAYQRNGASADDEQAISARFQINY